MQTESIDAAAAARDARAFARTQRRALLEHVSLDTLTPIDIAVSNQGEILLERDPDLPAEGLHEARVWMGGVETGLLVVDGLLGPDPVPDDAARFRAVHDRDVQLDILSTDVVRWNAPGAKPQAFLVTDWLLPRAPYRAQEEIICDHLTSSHEPLIRLLLATATHPDPDPGAPIRVVSIDVEGMLVSFDDALRFVAFDRPCFTAEEADAALVRLAWQSNPNLAPSLLLMPKATTH
ncbi:MAG: DUF2470 domain-containing protein [Myxococcota bacterium]